MQTLRVWYNALRSFLLSYEFTNAKSDTSLFIFQKDSILAYFLVYVDDLLLIGNNTKFINEFQKDLSNKFSLKNLGSPSHFLGIEILPTSGGLFLTQHHYICDLLVQFKMHDAKPTSTSMSTSISLITPVDTPHCDVTSYRCLIGSLQHLALTRPDISFALNKLVQHMQHPTGITMQAAKCALRYLKGTIDHGLQLSQNLSPSIEGFCDSDWA
jgi:hypothetical protein